MVTDFFINCLHEAGSVSVVGMGSVSSLSWQDLNAWNEGSERFLGGWELTVIKALSSAYADQIEKSRKPNCPKPTSEDAPERDKVDKGIKAAFSMLAKKGK